MFRLYVKGGYKSIHVEAKQTDGWREETWEKKFKF